MKKKLVLICFGIFVAAFLLWPTTTQTVPCGPNADCEVVAKIGIGGGTRKIYSLISGKDTAKEANFNTITALLGSAAIAGFVYASGHSYKKTRSHKKKKMLRKNT